MLCKFISHTIRQKINSLLPLKESTDCLILKLRGYRQSEVERNIQIVKVNNGFLAKAYEEFIAGLISDAEYQLFKEGFNSRIQDAENNIGVLRKKLLRLYDNTYVTKIIKRFLEHEDISELNRNVVAKLIKSIVVSDHNHINVNFRYLDATD